MKKFEGMLFCTDIDGTLYNSQRTVSKENLDAIEYFKSQGGIFTFVTGRVPSTTKKIYELVKPNGPYGCFNGGAVYDEANKKFLFKTALKENFINLVKAVDENLPEMGIQLNTEKTVYFNKYNPAMVYFREHTGLPDISCHYTEVKESTLKVVFAHHDMAQMDALIQFLNNHPEASDFDFVRSEKHLYEILPKNTNKGLALNKMAEILNIDPQKTIAAGDYNNDVMLIKEAGIGFAVENAVDEAKAVADYITVSNDEHAIAEIIYGIENGKYKRK